MYESIYIYMYLYTYIATIQDIYIYIYICIFTYLFDEFEKQKPAMRDGGREHQGDIF